MKPEVEILARGVLVRGGRMLVCRNKRSKNTFLPGGHVEWGESARNALVREIREETDLKAAAGRFLGAAEHTFMSGGRRTCEINLVFEMSVRGVRPPRPINGAEDHLEFLWVPLNRLRRVGLEPRCLQPLVARWLKKRTPAERWASTY